MAYNLMSHPAADTVGESLLTLGGVPESQKTSSVGDKGENGDNGERAISDIELL